MSAPEYGSQEWADAIANEVLPLPVAGPGDWQAKAFRTDPPDSWPVLQVLFPWHDVGVEEGGEWARLFAVARPGMPLDSYSQTYWQIPYDEAHIGVMVGYWPDGRAPLVLQLAGRGVRNITLPSFNVPPVSGSVRIRVIQFRDRQQGEPVDGPWSAPVRVTHAYEYADANHAWTGDLWEDVPDDERRLIEHARERLMYATPPTLAPFTPMDRVGRPEWVGTYMPRPMTPAEAAGVS